MSVLQEKNKLIIPAGLLAITAGSLTPVWSKLSVPSISLSWGSNSSQKEDIKKEEIVTQPEVKAIKQEIVKPQTATPVKSNLKIISKRPSIPLNLLRKVSTVQHQVDSIKKISQSQSQKQKDSSLLVFQNTGQDLKEVAVKELINTAGKVIPFKPPKVCTPSILRLFSCLCDPFPTARGTEEQANEVAGIAAATADQSLRRDT